MQKLFFVASTTLGALAVMIGAFGAHALKDLLGHHGTLQVFETGSRYHFYHALALLLTALLMYRANSIWINYAGLAFLGGILLFSGALYTLSVTGDSRWGAVAPIGGVLLVAGWIMLLVGLLKGN